MIKFILIAFVIFLGGFYFFNEQPETMPEAPWQEFDNTVESPSILIFEKLNFAPSEQITFQVDNAMGEIIELPSTWKLELYKKDNQNKTDEKVADYDSFSFSENFYSIAAPNEQGFYSVKMLNENNEEDYETQFMVN